MNKSQQRQIDRLRRVAGFGSNHDKEFTATSKARALFTQAQSLVEEIETASKKPRGRGPARGFSSEKQQALKSLRDHLERIARTARLIEKSNDTFAGKFLLPDKRRKNDLASAAAQFAQDAEPVKAEFLSYEMPKNFLKELAASLAAYENADAKPAKPVGAKPAVNTALRGTLGQGQEILEALDVVINNKYSGQPEILEEWGAANNLEFTPRKRRGRKPKEVVA